MIQVNLTIDQANLLMQYLEAVEKEAKERRTEHGAVMEGSLKFSYTMKDFRELQFLNFTLNLIHK